MLYGRVKWFNAIKGFGFIEVNDEEDAFIHFTSIKKKGYRDLNDGQMVCFNLYRSNNGYVAEDVEPYFLNERLRPHRKQQAEKPKGLVYSCVELREKLHNKK